MTMTMDTPNELFLVYGGLSVREWRQKAETAGHGDEASVFRHVANTLEVIERHFFKALPALENLPGERYAHKAPKELL